MKKITSLWVVLCLTVLLPVGLHGQTRFRVMEYNVENLFDVHHDSLKNDYEFLPESKKKWDFNRYYEKLKQISKVITAVGGMQVPDLVALCEVENDSTIFDLTHRSPLRVAGYDYVMTQCADERGIDVALLYQPSTFKPLQVEAVNVHPERIKRHPTRDILHVVGLLQSRDTLDVFVCHMPSRAGGKEESDAYRAYTSQCLRNVVDSIQACRKQANILITGDFNDYPHDPALVEVLRAVQTPKRPEANQLCNLMWNVKPGTYRYKGEWGTLDQMIVSGNLLRNKRDKLHTSAKHIHIYQGAFLLEEDERYGGKTPKRTYFGMRYHGGYSDHLPIYIDLFF